MDQTWNERIVGAIKFKNVPLTRRDLEMYLNIKDSNTLGVMLNLAKKQGVVAHVRIPPARRGYYCSPDWLDEQGNLKEEYKIKPYWDESNQNKPTRISHTGTGMGRNK